MMERTIRSATVGQSPVRKMLLMLGGVVMILALSLGPAHATTTFTVNETGDAVDAVITDDRCDSDDATAGRQCTLRAAIEEANDTAGADTIDFDLGGAGARAISPASALPTITDTATIDGYTQAGASENTQDEGNDAVLNVILGGLSAGAFTDGIVIEAPNCTVKGLLIRNFGGYGIVISGATGNHIEGNFIGANRDGVTDKGNGYGLFIGGDSNTVGGAAVGARNVISGNDDDGVYLYSDGNTVEGNYIGTTADGTAGLGNDGDGVIVSGTDNTIGGTEAGAGNVISGNENLGVYIRGGAADNRIEGNFVGTTADGTADLGNDDQGVVIIGDSNTVGGSVAGARNVISGNEDDGVQIYLGATDNRVEGNYIGTTADGRDDLGNAENGVFVASGANFTSVGGTIPGTGNRIAYNGGDGVSVSRSDSVGNNLLSNRIYRNAGLGIDLVGGTEDASGVTANDPDDPDAGPNNLQNFPLIRSAVSSSATGETTINGRLNSNPSQDFEVQCFLTNGAPASAHGEGSRLLGTDVVSTSPTGDANFSCVGSLPAVRLIPGPTATTTATNLLTGDTSEFSRNKTITNGP